jgi:hypothetical protein
MLTFGVKLRCGHWQELETEDVLAAIAEGLDAIETPACFLCRWELQQMAAISYARQQKLPYLNTRSVRQLLYAEFCRHKALEGCSNAYQAIEARYCRQRAEVVVPNFGSERELERLLGEMAPQDRSELIGRINRAVGPLTDQLVVARNALISIRDITCPQFWIRAADADPEVILAMEPDELDRQKRA